MSICHRELYYTIFAEIALFFHYLGAKWCGLIPSFRYILCDLTRFLVWKSNNFDFVRKKHILELEMIYKNGLKLTRKRPNSNQFGKKLKLSS